jgi:hypothetical protein
MLSLCGGPLENTTDKLSKDCAWWQQRHSNHNSSTFSSNKLKHFSFKNPYKTNAITGHNKSHKIGTHQSSQLWAI